MKSPIIFTDIMDEVMMSVYKLSKEELNFLFDKAKDDELKLMLRALSQITTSSSFTDKRKALEVKHKYLKLYASSNI
jgi:hypothetical protein